MATNLVKIHFLASKGAYKDGNYNNGSNAIIIQDYDPVNDKYVYGMIDVGYYLPKKSPSSEEIFDTTLLINYLKAHKITTLEFVVITHYHSDHYGNILYLLEEYDKTKIYIKNLILPMDANTITNLGDRLSSSGPSKLINDINTIKAAFDKYVQNFYSSAKLHFFGKSSAATIASICKIGTGTFRFYNTGSKLLDYPPYAEATTSSEKTTDRFSLVTVYTVQGRKVLFAGDIYKQSELLLKDELSDDYDLIQMSHHGSSAGNCQEFLDAIIPEAKECTAIQLKASPDGTPNALNRYLSYNDISGHAFVRVYGVHQDFEKEWGNVDSANRGSIVAEIRDGNIKYYSRRVFGDTNTYSQKLIHAEDMNNIKLDKTADAESE